MWLERSPNTNMRQPAHSWIDSRNWVVDVQGGFPRSELLDFLVHEHTHQWQHIAYAKQRMVRARLVVFTSMTVTGVGTLQQDACVVHGGEAVRFNAARLHLDPMAARAARSSERVRRCRGSPTSSQQSIFATRMNSGRYGA